MNIIYHSAKRTVDTIGSALRYIIPKSYAKTHTHKKKSPSPSPKIPSPPPKMPVHKTPLEIAFNKKEYVEHCKRLMTEDLEPQQYIESKDYLLNTLYAECRKKAKQFYKDDTMLMLLERIDDIFKGINHVHEDTKSTGIVNIVSLQCATLFTYASLGWKEPTDEEFDMNNTILRDFRSFVDTKNPDWINFDSAVKNVTSSFGMLSNLYDSQKFLITIGTYFTLKQIIEDFLDEKIVCGIVFEKTWADGFLMTPFHFIEHDLIHYDNYGFICNNNQIGYGDFREDLRNVYEKVKHNKDALVILFIVIHEGMCKWWDTAEYDLRQAKNNPFFPRVVNQERFFEDKDLGMLIPKAHKTSHETRIAYLQKAREEYIKIVKEYRGLQGGGGNTKKKQQARPTATAERIMYKGKQRVVYIGTRGGRYIKQSGGFIRCKGGEVFKDTQPRSMI